MKMCDIRKLIIKTSVKIIAAIVLCVIISIIATSVTPHLTNDLAVGQLQNDDISWTLMNAWNQIQNYASIAYGVVTIVCGISVVKDFYIFFKNRKDN